VRLEVVTPTPLVEGRPAYVLGDHAFKFEALTRPDVLEVVGDAGTTSLALDSLQLEVSLRTRRCLWLWGYSPRTRWISGKIADPEAEDGSAEVHGVELARGISIKMPGAPFRKLFDTESGWFGVFGSNRVGGQGVRIATDTVLFVRDGVFGALLVRPANWRELAKLQPL
jgi:hypothetical protein